MMKAHSLPHSATLKKPFVISTCWLTSRLHSARMAAIEQWKWSLSNTACGRTAARDITHGSEWNTNPLRATIGNLRGCNLLQKAIPFAPVGSTFLVQEVLGMKSP